MRQYCIRQAPTDSKATVYINVSKKPLLREFVQTSRKERCMYVQRLLGRADKPAQTPQNIVFAFNPHVPIDEVFVFGPVLDDNFHHSRHFFPYMIAPPPLCFEIPRPYILAGSTSASADALYLVARAGLELRQFHKHENRQFHKER